MQDWNTQNYIVDVNYFQNVANVNPIIDPPNPVLDDFDARGLDALYNPGFGIPNPKTGRKIVKGRRAKQSRY